MAKHRIFYRLMVLLMVLGVSFPLASKAVAQAPDPKQNPATQSQGAQSVELHLSNWGYDDVTLVGPYSITSYAIGLPYNWEIQPGSTLSLPINYIFGGAVSGVNAQAGSGATTYTPAASVEVKLNGKGIFRTIFYDLGQQTLDIPLPGTWPAKTEDNDRLDISFHVYGPCENAPFGSLTISKNASLSLKYKQNQAKLDLSLYPVPFYQRTFLPNAVDMVIPDKANALQLTAGLTVAAGLGSLTNNQVVIQSITDTSFKQNSPSQENIILVGTPDQNSLIADVNGAAQLPVSLQKRRFNVSVSGPGSFVPGSPLTYSIQVSNPESSPAADLQLTGLLPDLAQSVSCDQGCSTTQNSATWKIASLAANGSATYSLTFTPPEKYDKQAFALSAELAQVQKAVNISTLTAQLQSGNAAASIQAKPASDYFFSMNNRAVPENVGIIEILPSPWQMDKGLLLVTGLTDEAVYKAGNALGASVHFPGMNGQAALVEDVLPKEESVRQQSPDITLAELGYKDQVATGTGRKDIFYTFDLPLNWNLTEEASVRLAFSHSTLLDPLKSSLTIFLNDTPIASTALDKDNAIKGELTGKLSPGSAKSGQKNTLLVQIEADLNDVCLDPETPQSWVSIDASSNLHLAHQTVDEKGLTSFNYWPHQFTNDLTLSNVLFALPEQPDAVEKTIALQTAAFLGTASGGTYFAPTVITGKPDGIDLAKYHVITVGSPARNAVLQSVNDALPQPFIVGSNKILQKLDNIIFQLPDDLNLGYLQLIPSPWNPERVVLAITGTTDQGLENAASLVNNAGKIWQLKGNLTLVRGDKIFTTDTRQLTKKGNAEFLTTAVPEATTTAAPTATQTPIPTTLAGASNNTDAPKTLAQQYPLLIPGIAGASGLVILVILAFVLRKSGRGG